MLARCVVAAVASLIMLGALTLPATAHDPPASQTIQLKEGGQFLHWHGPTTPVATVFSDVTIVWRWNGSAWSQAYLPLINRGAFNLEEGDFLWVVSPSAHTITLEPVSEPTPATPSEPTPSLLELARASGWYRDGLDPVDGNNWERSALTALRQLDHSPDFARAIGRWEWLFDEDILPHESRVVEALAYRGVQAPDLAALIVAFPWLSDGLNTLEASAVSSLFGMDRTQARALAAAPWVMDGITPNETRGLDGLVVLSLPSNLPNYPRVGHVTPEDLQWIASLIIHQPRDLEFFLMRQLSLLRLRDPDVFERLLREPWFSDGLDDKERAYVIAATESGREQLFDPYTAESVTITLPRTGAVTLWAVQHGPVLADSDVLTKLEEAVRGSEQFWELPFPATHVILYIARETEFGGYYVGSMIALQEDNLSSRIVNHEVAHYYFHAGSSWFSEGGAEVVSHYIAHHGNIPSVGFPEHCREEGIENLQAINALIDDEEVWHPCRYPMGMHFLITLRETMGEKAWLSALQAFYLEATYAGLVRVNRGDYRDERLYQVFLEHTSPELVSEVNALFRDLHGGPFITPDN